MKQLLSPSLVKQSLSSHSWLGIAMGAMLYLVCLSGSIAVFYPEFERWEQPRVEPVSAVSGDLAQRAYDALVAQTAQVDADATDDGDHHHHRYVLMPTEDNPRLVVADDEQGWFVNADGTLGEKVAHDWTHVLTDLHLYLHLPTSFGMIVVSILGAMLCGLIISGFLSHPRIFKDAFALRLKASPRLQQADVHNRLSVWGAPFYLTIAITGAFFGLANLFGYVAANAFYDGDLGEVIPAIYGAEPELDQPPQAAQVGRALAQMHSIAPEATPLYITIEGIDSPEQFIMVGATHPGRLIYAEQYRFDSAGSYMDKVGFSDGDAGRQAIFSVYRIHFGHFGGEWVQWVYALLGLALTVISVSGINIWLSKRKKRDALNNLWTGIVWGTPVGLSASALASIGFGITSIGIFWGAILLAMVWAQIVDSHPHAKRRLQAACALLLAATAIAHVVVFGQYALSGTALGVNISLLVLALAFALTVIKSARTRHQHTSEIVQAT
ncbi:PepSY-associated TM helix domain-containing protein [Gilvimarinus sp. SDUM040013]|uniref:PepSY-associated TM helix domain-containing protein n=1 Tax=Gilvimarinus gilvus TaxID=3058038 RepID=A0ABU4S673_9GAMM|nr:PepSY-associated TM helix domain-containing protein [Gilvimarinus sp. SDUM040013]MDO3387238.1 PepSY-associated TM helix domain-containing protein [Gilvimarinus sp. SDUM040013]MDX6851403.1 PepSY-associated TM helix domain-containing protein [Gilvimarinus sp. SDUM040013]